MWYIFEFAWSELGCFESACMLVDCSPNFVTSGESSGKQVLYVNVLAVLQRRNCNAVSKITPARACFCLKWVQKSV
jgi:hypothetical protein